MGPGRAEPNVASTADDTAVFMPCPFGSKGPAVQRVGGRAVSRLGTAWCLGFEVFPEVGPDGCRAMDLPPASSEWRWPGDAAVPVRGAEGNARALEPVR